MRSRLRMLAFVLAAGMIVPASRTIRMLRWRSTGSTEAAGWLAWILNLFRWVAQSARVLMWAGIAAFAGVLLFYIVRMIHGHSMPVRGESFVAPSHVRDLDIRPGSLPADIGAAARQLWDRGEHRAALALLYRGLLSRLAHIHRVPIRDSTTEGDCLALSAVHLPPGKHAYATRLVRVWQRAVYGGEDADTPGVHALCAEFGPEMDVRHATAMTVPPIGSEQPA